MLDFFSSLEKTTASEDDEVDEKQRSGATKNRRRGRAAARRIVVDMMTRLMWIVYAWTPSSLIKPRENVARRSSENATFGALESFYARRRRARDSTLLEFNRNRKTFTTTYFLHTDSRFDPSRVAPNRDSALRSRSRTRDSFPEFSLWESPSLVRIFVKMSVHGAPPDGLECLCLFEDIDASNYVEYRAFPSGVWRPAKFCESVVEQFLDTQFEKYMDDVEKASKDCAAAVRRLVVKGPPTHLSDPIALALDGTLKLLKEWTTCFSHLRTHTDGEERIDLLWFSSSNTERSALLKGALVGDERERLWNDQKEVLASMEAAE